MEVWRINVREKTLQCEPVPAAWQPLGGRGLIARILLDEVPAACDPLGPENKLIFTPGLLVGHMLSSMDRISVGGKSPLTGGVKEANAGGTTGLKMALLAIKALVIEDAPANAGFTVLHLSRAGARFEPADDLVGLGVYDTAARLRERYGNEAAAALIGPGGEWRLSSAGIQNLDKEGVPSRIAARGGLGALMGAKGLKAIVFDAQGCEKPPLFDPQAFRAAQKVFTQSLLAHPQTSVYRDYGTAGVARLAYSFGALPTRNFTAGDFAGIEDISAETLRQTTLDRGGEGETTHACMPGCAIQCSNTFPGRDGKAIVSPLEYETIGMLGANLEISDLDTIARLNWEVNDLGLDSIEIGAAFGLAAQAGLMTFGDGDSAMALLGEIRRGTPLGRVIGSGVALTGRVLGSERIPAVKGQAMSAYEPRALKGTGVTYATSPQGADHTSGLTIRAKVDHLEPKGQIEVSRAAQINMAGYDTLGACIFAGFGFAAILGTIADLLNARYGTDFPATILQDLGRETLKLEREFNQRAGFTHAQDRLPEWMTSEPLPPHHSVFDVSEEDLDGVFNW